MGCKDEIPTYYYPIPRRILSYMIPLARPRLDQNCKKYTLTRGTSPGTLTMEEPVSLATIQTYRIPSVHKNNTSSASKRQSVHNHGHSWVINSPLFWFLRHSSFADFILRAQFCAKKLHFGGTFCNFKQPRSGPSLEIGS